MVYDYKKKPQKKFVSKLLLLTWIFEELLRAKSVDNLMVSVEGMMATLGLFFDVFIQCEYVNSYYTTAMPKIIEEHKDLLKGTRMRDFSVDIYVCVKSFLQYVTMKDVVGVKTEVPQQYLNTV